MAVEDKRKKRTKNKIAMAIRNIARCYKRHCIRNVDIARMAEIDNSTVYAYQRNADDTINNYLEETKAKAKELFKLYYQQKPSLEQSKIAVKRFYSDLMFYIYKNRLQFEIEGAMDKTDLWEAILEIAQPLIMPVWGNYNYTIKKGLYNCYSWSVIGILEKWGAENFSINSLDKYKSEIIALTDAAPKVFMWLVQKDLRLNG